MKSSILREIIREEVSKALNELEPQNNNPFYVLGFQVGPNGGNANTTGKEAKIILSKLDLPLDKLEVDKDIVQFVKGYVDSRASRSVQYDGIATIAPLLLRLKKKGWPKPGYIL